MICGSFRFEKVNEDYLSFEKCNAFHEVFFYVIVVSVFAAYLASITQIN
jgi:hypothetical protein